MPKGRRAAVVWAEKNRTFAQTGIFVSEGNSLKPSRS